MRSQDLLTPADPVGLDGTIARISPLDGLPAPGNPISDPGNAGRIVAFGLRNPFRFALRPGTDEIWIADVGWTRNDEIDVTTPGRVDNYGWPCFEGRSRQPRYTKAKLPGCEALSPKRDVRDPFLTYRHGTHVVPGEACEATSQSAISGIEFDRGSHFPFPFDGAMLFADYIRGCIWSVGPGRFGRPDKRGLALFENGAASPIDLTSSPGGILYVDVAGGTIHEISYAGPTAELRVQTKPKGLRVKIGERTELGGARVTVRRGASMRLGVPKKVTRGERVLEFSGWSDGGSRLHRLQVDANTTVTASYRCRKGCGKHGIQLAPPPDASGRRHPEPGTVRLPVTGPASQRCSGRRAHPGAGNSRFQGDRSSSSASMPKAGAMGSEVSIRDPGEAGRCGELPASLAAAGSGAGPVRRSRPHRGCPGRSCGLRSGTAAGHPTLDQAPSVGG